MYGLEVVCYILAALFIVILGLLAIFKIFVIGWPNYCKSQAKLYGKTVIVTGGNSGIGKETALDLANRGARVIIATRSESRGRAAVQDIINDTGNTNVNFMHLDLGNLNSVRDFAKKFHENENRLDILINNAGLRTFTTKQHLTEQGLELEFGVMHIGHFLLTNLLIEDLKKSAPSRIINVSSLAFKYSMHCRGDDNFLECKNPAKGKYKHLEGYENSKLANVMHANELARRLRGTGVTTYSLHPGGVATNIWQNLGEGFLMDLVRSFFNRFIFWDCKAGAQTTIYCAVEESLETVSGLYYDNCKASQHQQTRVSLDESLAKKLWDISEELIEHSEK